MTFFPLDVMIFFAVLSLGASFINGGLGYGYSSVSTPLAILVLVNRIVNPAYVLLEAMMNTVMLSLTGKKNIKATFRRSLPVIVALVPGVIIGSLILSRVAPLWIRFLVYVLILPLILLQVAGFRRPIKSEAAAAAPLGMGIGLLYSITTISGPPIALFFNNQGIAKQEFKAAIAQVRIAESYLTCLSYYLLGLFSAASLSLFTVIAPPVLLGIPLGILVVRRIQLETFRRYTMTFDAAIVGFGLTTVLQTLFGIGWVTGYAFWFTVLGIDITLLYRYMRRRTPLQESTEKRPIPVVEAPPQPLEASEAATSK